MNNRNDLHDAARRLPTWRKSSYSSPSGDNCVEVAFAGGAVGMRDSKNPDTAVLLFTAAQWRTFVDDVKAGGFDHTDR